MEKRLWPQPIQFPSCKYRFGYLQNVDGATRQKSNRAAMVATGGHGALANFSSESCQKESLTVPYPEIWSLLSREENQ